MDFDLNAEERAVVGAVRSLMASRPAPASSPGRVEPHDPALWSELAYDLGLVPMALPESAGGDGGGVVLGGLAARELGSVLYGGPYLSCLIGALALVESESEEVRDVLGRTVGGSGRPTYAPGRGSDVSARRTSSGWVVDGVARGVLDVAGASHVVVAATDDTAATAHHLVDLKDPGVDVVAVPGFDLTRETGTVRFTGARAVPVSAGECANADRARALHRAKALVASEQVGGSRGALAAAVDHARMRHQFGRPIGSFQGVKHQLADILVRTELAEVTVDHVLCLLDADETVGELAATALAAASDTYADAALTAVHTHGGLGITWESGLHLHVRRSKATAALLGSPAHQRRLALADLGW